jgi:hypothetical protein
MKLNPKLYIDRPPTISSSDRVRHFSKEDEKESYKLKTLNDKTTV